MNRREKGVRFLAQALGGAAMLLMGILTVVELTESTVSGPREWYESLWFSNGVILAIVLAVALLLWPVGRLLAGGWRKALGIQAKGMVYGALLGLGIMAFIALITWITVLVVDPIYAAYRPGW